MSSINPERVQILKMLHERKISVEEAIGLLDAVETQTTPTANILRIHIMEEGLTVADIKLPLSLAHSAVKFTSFARLDTDDLDWNHILAMIQAGKIGRIVEIKQSEKNRKIEVFVE